MNSRQLNAVTAVMVAGLAIGLAGCDDPVQDDGQPRRLSGVVQTRHPDEFNDDGVTCNILGLKTEDGVIRAVCVSNAEYDRHPVGTTYSRG